MVKLNFVIHFLCFSSLGEAAASLFFYLPLPLPKGWVLFQPQCHGVFVVVNHQSILARFSEDK